MSKFATGALIFIVLVLLFLNMKMFSRLRMLDEKVGAISRAAPAAQQVVPSAASPAPAILGAAGPSPPESAGAPSTDRGTSKVVEETRMPGLPSPKRFQPDRRAISADSVPDLTDEQKRAVADLMEGRRKELLMIDGEVAARKRDVDRRAEAMLRNFLSPAQLVLYDAQKKATTPNPDGPVTPQAKDLVQKDPAPYDLEVEWSGTWWPARTVGTQGEMTLIHFVGHGQEWHEWVPPERARARR